jgi:hypothetical protein
MAGAAAGGMDSSGGTAGTGGAVGVAGTAGTGGAIGVAGTSSTGGQTGTGGMAGSGGQSQIGGTAGTPPTGGASGSGGGGPTGGAGGDGGTTQQGDLHVTTALDEDDPGATVADPGGDGLSLREALALSNAGAGDLEITFESSLVIPLDSQLEITQSVSIQGGGTTLDCSGVGSSRDCLSLAVGSGTTSLNDIVLVSARRRPIRLLSGSDYRITNCTIRDANDAVEVGADATNVLFAGNWISGSGTDGIDVFGTSVAILDNVIVDSTARGIFVSADGTRIVGNLVIRGNRGIQVSPGFSDAIIRHNTVVYQAGDGILVDEGLPAEVTNNTVAHTGGWAIISGDSAAVTRNHNAYFDNASGICSGCTVDPNAITTDPLFSDPGLDDFTLNPASPLIDAGTDTGEDRNGSRAGLFDGTAPDIGHVEVR